MRSGLNYIPNPPPPSHPLSQDPTHAALVETIAARRRQHGHPEGLVELDRILLHAPAVASGWNAFLAAIRTQTDSLADDVREVVICRVAVVNGAAYEWGHHVRILRQALVEGEFKGEGEERVETVLRVVRGTERAEALDALGKQEWARKVKAVVAYTDAMTRTVKVPDDVWEEFRAVCQSEKEAVEITSTCAAYNCVSRFLVALDIGEAEWD